MAVPLSLNAVRTNVLGAKAMASEISCVYNLFWNKKSLQRLSRDQYPLR